MIEPPERSAGEVEGIINELREEVAEGGEAAARQFIDKMMDSGNRVLQNDYGRPIVELIAPLPMQERIEELIEEWDLNPSGHGAMAQAPSFEEERPEISQALVAWQFMVKEDEPDDLNSCGYDLETIMEELEDDPVLATTARKVKADLPW